MNQERSARRRLKMAALTYVPLAAAGTILTFVYDVGAEAGGEPSDVFLRGSALGAPVFLPVGLVAASLLVEDPRTRGTVATAAMGLVGLAFLGGSTVNLPNDLDAARAAGSPVGLTVGNAVLHFGLGIFLVSNAFLALRERRSRPQLT